MMKLHMEHWESLPGCPEHDLSLEIALAALQRRQMCSGKLADRPARYIPVGQHGQTIGHLSALPFLGKERAPVLMLALRMIVWLCMRSQRGLEIC